MPTRPLPVAANPAKESRAICLPKLCVSTVEPGIQPPSARQTPTSGQRNCTLHLSLEAAACPVLFFSSLLELPVSGDLEAIPVIQVLLTTSLSHSLHTASLPKKWQ